MKKKGGEDPNRSSMARSLLVTVRPRGIFYRERAREEGVGEGFTISRRSPSHRRSIACQSSPVVGEEEAKKGGPLLASPTKCSLEYSEERERPKRRRKRVLSVHIGATSTSSSVSSPIIGEEEEDRGELL